MISFSSEKEHHNLIVRLLSDHFGIQVRGGCYCAGTYGHYLLNVLKTVSRRIIKLIDSGDLSLMPGWVGLSLHPTLTDAELNTALNAILSIQNNSAGQSADYVLSPATGEYIHRSQAVGGGIRVNEWFHIE